LDNNIEVESALLDSGEVRLGFKLTPDHQASLEALHNSPHWKVYREILLSAKTEFFNSVLPLKDPTEITKQVGIVCGLNFAINQLPVLVAGHKAKREKAMEKQMSDGKLSL
jgi:hypothetical protein